MRVLVRSPLYLQRAYRAGHVAYYFRIHVFGGTLDRDLRRRRPLRLGADCQRAGPATGGNGDRMAVGHLAVAVDLQCIDVDSRRLSGPSPGTAYPDTRLLSDFPGGGR